MRGSVSGSKKHNFFTRLVNSIHLFSLLDVVLPFLKHSYTGWFKSHYIFTWSVRVGESACTYNMVCLKPKLGSLVRDSGVDSCNQFKAGWLFESFFWGRTDGMFKIAGLTSHEFSDLYSHHLKMFIIILQFLRGLWIIQKKKKMFWNKNWAILT